MLAPVANNPRERGDFVHTALRSDTFGPELKSGDAKPASGVNKFLMASVVAVAAGAVAVTPVSPVTSAMSAVSDRVVELAADANPLLADPLTIWQNDIAGTIAAVSALAATYEANPAPILSQLIINQQAYLKQIIGAAAAPGQRRGTGILGSIEGIQKTITNFQDVRIPDSIAYFLAGQLTASWAEIEAGALIGLENIGQPLLTLLTPTGDILQNVADVYDALVTRGAASGLTRALLAPPITLSFALANAAETITSAVNRGDFESAITAAINAPGFAVGAFLNGYRPVLTYDADGNPLTYATEAFQGIFSKNGTVDQLLNVIPKAIQTALKPTVTTTAAVVASPAISTAKTVTLDVPAAVEAAPAVEADDTTATAGKSKATTSTHKALKAASEGSTAAPKATGAKKGSAAPRHAKKEAAESSSDSE